MVLNATPNAFKTTSNWLKTTSKCRSFGLNEAIFRRKVLAGKGLPKCPHEDIFNPIPRMDLRRKMSADGRLSIHNDLRDWHLRQTTETEDSLLVIRSITSGCGPDGFNRAR